MCIGDGIFEEGDVGIAGLLKHRNEKMFAILGAIKCTCNYWGENAKTFSRETRTICVIVLSLSLSLSLCLKLDRSIGWCIYTSVTLGEICTRLYKSLEGFSRRRKSEDTLFIRSRV